MNLTYERWAALESLIPENRRSVQSAGAADPWRDAQEMLNCRGAKDRCPWRDPTERYPRLTGPVTSASRTGYAVAL